MLKYDYYEIDGAWGGGEIDGHALGMQYYYEIDGAWGGEHEMN